jgi:hypothetical protein
MESKGKDMEDISFVDLKIKDPEHEAEKKT